MSERRDVGVDCRDVQSLNSNVATLPFVGIASVNSVRYRSLPMQPSRRCVTATPRLKPLGVAGTNRASCAGIAAVVGHQASTDTNAQTPIAPSWFAVVEEPAAIEVGRQVPDSNDPLVGSSRLERREFEPPEKPRRRNLDWRSVDSGGIDRRPTTRTAHLC
jgi:hypothetical protein